MNLFLKMSINLLWKQNDSPKTLYTSDSAYIMLQIWFYSDAYSFISLYTAQFLSQKPCLDYLFILLTYLLCIIIYCLLIQWLYTHYTVLYYRLHWSSVFYYGIYIRSSVLLIFNELTVWRTKRQFGSMTVGKEHILQSLIFWLSWKIL